MDGRSFGGVNLLDAISSNYSADGHYGKDAIGHAFAMLGLKAAGQPVPPKAAQYLMGVQTPEGGWAFSGDTKAGGADTNTTAVVVQALVAAGTSETDPVMTKAEEYLLSQENASDGGFPYQKGGEFGSDSDVNSTAYVVQAMHYLGEKRGLGFILSMQKPNGAFQWTSAQPEDNPGATYQAITAILGATLIDPKGNFATVPSGPEPGMPTTGSADTLLAALGVAAAGMLALASGVALRRRAG
jgi:prenyltransferase beta subunit